MGREMNDPDDRLDTEYRVHDTGFTIKDKK
jgi:hypothetical protein